VRRRPYSIVLFDEIDKAHPEVFNVLLQVLDDGRITDGQGRTVNFKNTIIILTSNIAAEIILEGGEEAEVKRMALERLQMKYRPEFINRLDDIVIFNPLSSEVLRSIARLTLNAVSERLADKQITLRITDDAIDVLTLSGYSRDYGARPLKRVIQKELETPIAHGIVGGDFLPGDTLGVAQDPETGKIMIAVAQRSADVKR